MSTEEITGTKPFDFNGALRQLARHRLKRDSATVAQIQLADKMASQAAGEFGLDAAEAAGLGMTLAASIIADLIRHGLSNPAVLANVMGQRLVADARAAGEVSR
jgi:hypothetical protein